MGTVHSSHQCPVSNRHIKISLAILVQDNTQRRFEWENGKYSHYPLFCLFTYERPVSRVRLDITGTTDYNFLFGS